MYYYVQKGIFYMKKFKLVVFFVFIALYVIGTLIGSVSLVGNKNQVEMYEYLEGAVSEYNVQTWESIKQILEGNLKTFALLVFGGMFLLGPVVMAGVMVIKGYTTGFAITAMLRLFGMRGLTFCIANLLSCAIIIPAIAWYSCEAITNILNNRYEKNTFMKCFLVRLLVMIPILLIDGVLRGFLSSILMKLA